MADIPKESILERNFDNIFLSLSESYGAFVKKEDKYEGAFVVQFNFENAVTTIRILVNDSSGADIVITNMTTLPETEQNKGFGSRAIGNIVSWAKENDLKVIMATQVQEASEKFWLDNGFVKKEGHNPCNDFIYKDSHL